MDDQRPSIFYFGPKWDAPVFDDTHAIQVKTPVELIDPYCQEQVVEGDQGFIRAGIKAGGSITTLAVHRECELRNVVGGLAHVQGRCTHTGHCNELRQQEGRSLREDALAVWQWVVEDQRELGLHL